MRASNSISQEEYKKISKDEEKKEKKSKYKSKKTTIDGIVFHSEKEATRYTELKLLQRLGKISDLELQKEFVLIPSQREASTFNSKGKEIKGKVIEKKCSYYADFCYKDEIGNYVVEDTKSGNFRTTDYVIKRKLMLFIHGIRISEL